MRSPRWRILAIANPVWNSAMMLSPFAAWVRSRLGPTPSAPHLRTALEGRAAAHPGPPLIALARALYAHHPDIRIDPLETESRSCRAGFEIRAWVLVSSADLPVDRAEAITATLARLDAVSPTARRIFFLSAAYHMTTRDIGLLLGMRSASVRRTLVRAIASLDQAHP